MILQYTIADGTLTTSPITWEEIDEETNKKQSFYATKLQFQAPEGTSFYVQIANTGYLIKMNHYGIYQLNLPDNLIRGFGLANSSNSIDFGILEVEVPGFIDKNIRENIKEE